MINTNRKFHPKNDMRKDPSIIIIPILPGSSYFEATHELIQPFTTSTLWFISLWIDIDY